MKVRELNPKRIVWTVESESLSDAAKRLVEEDIGALLIENGSGPVGVLSEKDFVRAIADGADLELTPVDEYMTASPVEISLDAPLSDVIAAMNEFGVRHIVVLDDGDEVGMVSARDVLRALEPDLVTS